MDDTPRPDEAAAPARSTLSRFFREQCIVDPIAETSPDRLWKAYQRWVGIRFGRTVSRTQFDAAVARRFDVADGVVVGITLEADVDWGDYHPIPGKPEESICEYCGRAKKWACSFVPTRLSCFWCAQPLEKGKEDQVAAG